MIKILLPNIKPVSVNNMFEFSKKTGRRYHPKKVKAFQLFLGANLVPYRKLFDDFQKLFIQTKHGLKVKYKFYIPEKKLITKKETISLTSGDVFNMEKILTDVMFKFMPCLDDSQILHGTVEKLSSKDDNWHIGIELEIINIPIKEKSIIQENQNMFW